MIESATEKLGINLGSKVQSVLETLNKTYEEPARIGQERYLGEYCPAPESWNQKDYEVQLEQAA